ncbi:hypothetical protein PENARI_c005G07031 [Penicillium arizonense]|uniref:CENP-V/GFA domain-containing protein n=1 Tax=Penicillium arizonense TaxID=1835702 RepID=A0A1F5LNG5_PENAI|nr:hypothetical protein PENARI_c005G07031 [Penicillium arizonense]OGE54657.1 hypothetical protein PENARI_c005G07031 [Penicillium arizonense]
MAATKTLTASCRCKSVQFTVTIPTECLPLNVHLCHCSLCRYTHGTPCSFHAPLPYGVEPQFIAPSSLEKLTSYQHLASKATGYFCSTCGCQIGGLGSQWTISTAIFDANREDEGIWKFNAHMLPNSAPDGGLAAVFSDIDGHKLQTENLGLSPQAIAGSDSQPPDPESKELLAQCHCGGVSFTIARPSEEFIASPAGKEWISPLDKSKWLASMDLCDDCRLVNGTHVVSWMFVSVDHITPRLPKDLLIGSAKGYRSMKDVLRVFCGTCGATIFYHCDERPNIVDVAMGILRAPEGAMAENWSVWRAGRPSWPENGMRYHAGFSRALIEGMKQWGAERGHPQEFKLA